MATNSSNDGWCRARFMAVVCAALAGAVPGAAHAGVDDKVKSLRLNVHGEILQSCELGQIDNINFGDLAVAAQPRQAKAAFRCNVPFQVTVQAEKGALANVDYPLGQGPYAGSLPYRLSIAIPIEGAKGNSGELRKDYASSKLMGGGESFSSGERIALGGMNLAVVLGSPTGEAGLLAGNYSETITITVVPG